MLSTGVEQPVCPVCDEYDVPIAIHGPGQLRRIVAKIKDAVRNGQLRVDDEGSRREINMQAAFLEFDVSETLPDCIHYYFHCTGCERPFILSCNTYHGSGGSWARV